VQYVSILPVDAKPVMSYFIIPWGDMDSARDSSGVFCGQSGAKLHPMQFASCEIVARGHYRVSASNQPVHRKGSSPEPGTWCGRDVKCFCDQKSAAQQTAFQARMVDRMVARQHDSLLPPGFHVENGPEENPHAPPFVLCGQSSPLQAQCRRIATPSFCQSAGFVVGSRRKKAH